MSNLKAYFPEVRARQLTVVGEEQLLVSPSRYSLRRVQQFDLDLVPDSLIPEAMRELPLEDLVVWVDPLDGTQSFIEGDFNAVTTLIGVSYRHQAALGVVHQVCSSPPTTYWV
jgi:3'(2'), 5'-bisphosphate nucleotidase